MKIRPRTLPPGWYPGTELETKQTIMQYLQDIPEGSGTARAGVAPHAGWEFSGRVALEVFLNLKKDPDTIIVVGGHLHPSEGVMAAFEEGYETPLGTITADLELLERMKEEIPLKEDRYPDNTVEVQLPFVRYLFPNSRVLALRASPSADAVDLGKAIKSVAEALRKNVTVVGSTDLTHYGINYSFLPKGRGRKALQWVREVNDKGFIENLLVMDGEEALSHALKNHSACSAGGAVAALSFARESGDKAGKLLKYMTSYDVLPGESFVGYAGIVFV